MRIQVEQNAWVFRPMLVSMLASSMGITPALIFGRLGMEPSIDASNRCTRKGTGEFYSQTGNSAHKGEKRGF